VNPSSPSETDSLGLPRRMWWLWPFLVLLLVIWVISLWAVRVPQTTTIQAVTTAQQGLGQTARAEVTVLIPAELGVRPLGETVRLLCQERELKGQIDTEAGEILSVQDIRDLVGSRLLAERLFQDNVRMQKVVTGSGAGIPAPGEHCQVTIVHGQIRLLALLGGGLDS
jgi:hypothetical protein